MNDDTKALLPHRLKQGPEPTGIRSFNLSSRSAFCMNNKNCGCQQDQCRDGFVPVNGNWDFNMNGGCQRQNRCNTCEAAEKVCRRQRQAECDSYTNGSCTGRADCACERCARRRQNECDPCAKQKNKADNRGVGIVWARWQELDTVYDDEHALKAGTLYPELHMPMNGYWPREDNCADCTQEAAFVLWELRLYLNTHPCDKEAMALFRQMREKAEGTYAEVFLPEDCVRWAWTDDPWPWEYNCRSGADCDCRK
jgi:spore coat protein JB